MTPRRQRQLRAVLAIVLGIVLTILGVRVTWWGVKELLWPAFGDCGFGQSWDPETETCG